eukprot:gene29549-35666_t
MEDKKIDSQPPRKKAKRGANAKTEPPAVAPGLEMHRCNRDAHLKLEKRFKWRLSTDIQSDGSIVLDAWVLDNNLAVFVLPAAQDAISVTYSTLLEGSASTKLQPKKATTAVSQCMQSVASVLTADNRVIQLLAPFSGRLIEYNDRLTDQPVLLHTHHDSDGYIAICQSDTVKVFERCKNMSVSLQHAAAAKNTNICFAWAKTGICRKGVKCRFDHG